MPSASNGKSEKAASSEAPETPIRQVMTIIEHKIRNLEKRKSKLTSYRDLQKSGKDLNADQKIAVAKYDEVAQTLDFARDLSKQVASIAIVAERDAKKQAKKEAWVRNACDTSKIREVLLIQDCLTQLGIQENRDDFLNGSNGAVQLSERDLRILDDLYPEVTPKHEINEEGVSVFNGHVAKAAEHLYGIIDGKPKEVFGTTYTHIKQIVANVHNCGYFDKGPQAPEPEPVEVLDLPPDQEEVTEMIPEPEEPSPAMSPARMFPVPPSAAVVPAPAYPLRPVPPHMTLQEIEHAYFSQQYPPPRPIAEVIGSHDFYFLQDSELDSPVGTPQPPPAAIPTQTFTNQHYVPMEPQLHMPQHFAPLPPPEYVQLPTAPPLQQAPMPPMSVPPPHVQPPPLPPHNITPVPLPVESPRRSDPNTPVEDKEEDDWKENGSPEQDDNNDDKSKGQTQGDTKRRFRRYGRGPPNGFRGRGNYHNRQNNEGYQNRPNNDGYQNRQNDGYQNRQNDGYQNRQNDGYQSRQNNDGYQSRQNNDGYQNRHNDYRQNKEGYQGRQYNNDSYQSRHKDGFQNRNNDSYYGNGDAGHQQENGGTRARFESSGYRSRGPRGRGPPRGRSHFARKPAAAEAAE